MKVSGKMLLFVLILSGFCAPRCGATVYYSNGSAANVQALHNRALNGDTIKIPAGTFTWSTPVTISKGITILGAGIGNTIITSAIDVEAGQALFDVTSTGAVRISGLTCVGGPGDEQGFIQITSAGFRVDHCDFTNLTNRGVKAYSTATSWGVIHHCSFNKLSGSPQGVSIFGTGDAEWNRPLALGTQDGVYIEDCVFNWPIPADTVIDMYNGARAVFRYNTVNNAAVGCHGLDSGGYRSALKWEIYENVFNSNVSIARIFHFRGGTGVVFNNVVTATSTSTKIQLTCYRATGTCIFSEYVPWGSVTGSNPYDGNTDGYGYPALDQIGAAPPTDPPCIRDCGPPAQGYSVQGHSPAYAWGNTISLNGAPPVEMRMALTIYSGTCYPSCTPGDSCVANLIQHGRDFVNGTQKPGYTPYVYPHPLTLR
jgi:hypothetical protein